LIKSTHYADSSLLYHVIPGEVLDALIKMTNEEKKCVIKAVDQAMCNLGVNVPYGMLFNSAHS
jgi:hypothetical protein